MKEDRRKRLEAAIAHLISIGRIEGNSTASRIAEKMKRGRESVSAAINGNERYLSEKFVKNFCAVYGNVISAEWIWDGAGKMLVDVVEPQTSISDNTVTSKLESLTKEELISLVKQMIALHAEQVDMYKEMIRSGQERFNKITSLILNCAQ